MQQFLVGILSLALVSCVSPDTAYTQLQEPVNLTRHPKGKWNGQYFKQRQAKTQCFSPELRRIVRTIIREVGPIEITSGHRPFAGSSLHARCAAVDFRPLKMTNRDALRRIRKIEGIGGIGSYRRTTIIHVDTGPRREWHY